MRLPDFESRRSSRAGRFVRRLMPGAPSQTKGRHSRISPAPSSRHTTTSTTDRRETRTDPPRGRRRRGRRLRFGDFEYQPATRELEGPEGVVRLQPQPATLLQLLLESSGEVISREQVRRRLWADEIHVEFNQSMNTCVKRIRAALDDSAETPSYVETLPRLGYRFLAPVTEIVPARGLLAARGGRRGPRLRSVIVAALAATALTAGALVWRATTAPTASPCGEVEPTQMAGADDTTGGPDPRTDRERPPNP